MYVYTWFGVRYDPRVQWCAIFRNKNMFIIYFSLPSRSNKQTLPSLPML